MRRVIFGLLYLFAAPAICCIVPPQRTMRDHDSLLAEAESIVLVQVVTDSTESKCAFNVLRTWKTPVTKINVACVPPGKGDWMTDFSAHTEKSFWQNHDGRLGIHGDCSVVRPAFVVGEKYLLLLGIAPDVKQFEQVSSPDDRWLKYVEQRSPN